jgi:hypothetical protein
MIALISLSPAVAEPKFRIAARVATVETAALLPWQLNTKPKHLLRFGVVSART